MDDLDLGATIRGFSPGQKLFGRYTLKKQLGRGGMGVVWQARDESLEQDVAIKLLPEMVATDPVSIRELKRETRRSQALAHPHILKVHDFVEGGGLCGISMELVEGGTLSARRLEQAGETFTPAQLGAWVRQLCEALDYAHKKAKVVHRDLKPANLMLTPDGDLKVADFGIAASLSESVTRVSKQAGSSGTPLYMSPQQMMGDDPAVTDDIYALGATLYELLTGKPPFFSGNVLLQVQSKVPVTVNERLRANGHPGEPVPAEWEETIAACLAKEPKDRPQSASEVAERLGLGANGNVQRPTINAQRSSGGQKVGAVAPNGPSVERAVPTRLEQPVLRPGSTSVSKTPLIAALAAGVIFAAGLGWYFGIHVPEQKRLAQIALEAVASRAASQAGEKFGPDQPEPGQRWVVPDLSIEMIPIAAGSFRMGTDSADDDLNLAKPVTQVTISKPYWLARTEVTQEQWQALMGANPSKFKAAARPVERITEEQAMAFCEKLTARERVAGRLPAGYVYRLPTEAQWEYACRAGTTGHYAGEADALGWNQNNSGNSTQPVGQKQANAWGLHDMHGNVAEWCLDFKYGEYPGGAVTDFVSPGVARTKRGGSWSDHPISTASWARAYVAYDPSDEFTGMRVALVPDVPVPQPEKESPAVAKILQPQPGQPWENTLGQKFVPVPGINVLFCIWETREKDYAAFVKSSGRAWRNFNTVGDAHPAVRVSWHDAKAFCAWLTEKERREGKLGADQEYRLPTDAEWSIAVGLREASGTPQEKDSAIQGEYPWGAVWPPPRGAGNFGDESGKRENPNWTVINGYDDGYAHAAPVGSFPANQFGLYDLGGNVSEWCEDWYNSVREYRVLRGAPYHYGTPDFLLSSNRQEAPPDGGNELIGFRVVISSGASSASLTTASTKQELSIKAVSTAARKPTGGGKSQPQPGQPWENTLGQKFVPVPETGVLFCIWETRVQDYWAFIQATGREWSKSGEAAHPVVNVSWDDAQAFCAWLTKKEQAEGRLGPDQKYRLPMDAEWSLAVGLGNEGSGTPQSKDAQRYGVYPWGAQWPPPSGAGNYYASSMSDSFEDTSPVGSFGANPHGIYDLGGNVWEWCEDFFNGSSGRRVLRGASFLSGGSGDLLSSRRADDAPVTRNRNFGFRVVVTPGSSSR